jgi:hypothetical protein
VTGVQTCALPICRFTERAQADITIEFSSEVIDNVGYFDQVEITDEVSTPNQELLILSEDAQ